MSKREHRDKTYYAPKPGEWVQMSLPPRTNFDSCCDCGLVHRINFELRPLTSGKYKGELTLWRRLYRDDKATTAIRKQRVKTGELHELEGVCFATHERIKHGRAQG